jgi:Amt family ammonium transporter
LCGLLAGLVGVTGSCNNISPTVALAVGVISGIVFETFCKVLISYEIDDPLEASPLHGGCGLLGVFIIAFIDIVINNIYFQLYNFYFYL